MPALPITIGELTNVPTFSSPIQSPWAQDASRRIVHRFASAAARNAGYLGPLTGALAYTIDAGRLCMWDGVGWLILREPAQPAVTPISPVESDRSWPSDRTRPIFFNATGPSTMGGTMEGHSMRSNGRCAFSAQWTRGAGNRVTDNLQMALPWAIATTAPSAMDWRFHVALYSSGVDFFQGMTSTVSTTAAALLAAGLAGGQFVRRAAITATVPFTWKQNDQIVVHGDYPVASPYDT